MNAKTSFFNFGVFRENLKKYCSISAAMLGAWVLCYYAMAQSCMQDAKDAQNWMSGAELASFNPSHHVSSCLFELARDIPVFMLVVSFVVAMALFGYLFKARICRTIHSLPVSRTAFFLTNVVSGVVLLVLPILCGGILSGLHLSISGYSFTLILPTCLIALTSSLIFFGIAVLSIMIAGQGIMAPVTYALLNFGIIAFEALSRILVGSVFIYGYGSTFYDSYHSIFSPIIHIMMRLDFQEKTGQIVGTKCLWIYLAVSLLCLVLAFLLYRVRRLERSGEVIAEKKLEPLFHYLFTVAFAGFFTIILCSIFLNNRGYNYFSVFEKVRIVVLFLLCSLVVFYLIKMVLEKTRHVFRTKNPGLVIYLCLSLVLFGAFAFDAFGIEERIPKLEDVRSVTFSNGMTEIHFTDESAMGDVMALHKELITRKAAILTNDDKFIDSDDMCYNNVFLTYTLKNGKELIREYSYNCSPSLSTTANKEVQKLDQNIRTFLQSDRVIHQILSQIDGEITLEGYVEDEDYYTVCYIPDTETQTVLDAVRKDVAEGHSPLLDGNHYYEEVYNGISIGFDTQAADSEVDVCYVMLSLTKDCSNTLAALRDLGTLDENDYVIESTEEESYDESEAETFSQYD